MPRAFWSVGSGPDEMTVEMPDGYELTTQDIGDCGQILGAILDVPEERRVHAIVLAVRTLIDRGHLIDDAREPR